MYNHFSSSRRWVYVITSVVGGEHKHYIIYGVFDSNSIHRVIRLLDSAYNGYSVSLSYDNDNLFTCYPVIDSALASYGIANIVDNNSLYLIENLGDYNK